MSDVAGVPQKEIENYRKILRKWVVIAAPLQFSPLDERCGRLLVRIGRNETAKESSAQHLQPDSARPCG